MHQAARQGVREGNGQEYATVDVRTSQQRVRGDPHRVTYVVMRGVGGKDGVAVSDDPSVLAKTPMIAEDVLQEELVRARWDAVQSCTST